ncbi:RecQ family ATP-dependent DNA helicase [Myroides sp. LJL115]
MLTNALDVLKKYWKHQSFRPLQEQIIASVLDKKDTFALLPTGGGKSICFQIPALMQPGICLVVSPLIALIQDQIQNLNQKQIKATAIIGGMPMHEIDAVFDNCQYGNYKFIYISPERLEQDWILERLKKLSIQTIAIDEAHCISQWGHDFRPAYLKLTNLKTHFENTPIIALTGSANKRVIEDICQILQLDNPNIFEQSFYRENLIYGVYKVKDKVEIIQKILQKNYAPTIIYVRNRKETQNYAQALNSLGFKTSFYHGGLGATQKKKVLKQWLDQTTPIIVATNAFGMGIDKENVKNVIHVQFPENLENYYQEAGRAGRDGNRAFCSILVEQEEIQTSQDFFNSTLFDKEFLKLIYKKLNNFLNIAYGEGYNQRYSFNFNTFCKRNKFNTLQAFNALQFLDRQGIIKFTQNFIQNPRLQLTGSTAELFDLVQQDPIEEQILLQILSTYPGVYDQEQEIAIEALAQENQITPEQINQFLQAWHQEELVNYTPVNNDLSILFNEIYEQERTLYRTFVYLEKYNALKTAQFQWVLKYIQDDTKCKNNLLLEYFDQPTMEDCQICSSCIKNKNK